MLARWSDEYDPDQFPDDRPTRAEVERDLALDRQEEDELLAEWAGVSIGELRWQEGRWRRGA